MLGGRRTRSPGRAGSGTAAQSPIAHTARLGGAARGGASATAPPAPASGAAPVTRIARSTTTRPSASSGSPSRATTGLGLTPAVHTTVRAAIVSPSESVALRLLTSSERRVRAHLDAAPAQLALGEPGQARRDLLHDALARLDQHPAHPLRAAAGVELDRLGGEVLQLGEPLDAGVAGPDEHEAQVLGARGRVLQRLGDVEAVEYLVAQRGGVRERLQADRVLGEPGDRQRARDRAQRDDQLVVGELDRARRRCAAPTACAGGVGAAHAGRSEVGARSCERSGTTTWRGSSVEPAAPGSSGV